MWVLQATREYEAWFAGLDDECQKEVVAKVEALRTFGPLLSRPHADTLNGSRHSNMKELRGRTRASELRIAFAFDPERKGILLCAGDKTGVSQRLFYERLIDLADRLFDEHLLSVERRRKQRKGK